MRIKHKITFKLRPYGKNKTYRQIQLHVSYDSNRIKFSTGCQLNSDDAWDEEEQAVRAGYRGLNGDTALAINKELRKCRDEMETVFMYFEANDKLPSMKEVKARYEERMGIDKKSEKKEDDKKAKAKHEKKASSPTVVQDKDKPNKPEKITTLIDIFDLFTYECGEKNAWSLGTYKKMATLRSDLLAYKKNLKFSDFTEKGLTGFVHYLREEKVLKRPRKKKELRDDNDKESTVGVINSTIGKKLGYLKWFLNWATDNGYNDNIAFRRYHPTLKSTQKKVIYLTKEEMERIRDLKIPKNLSSLEPVRDVFLFCCFSGLRHSDVYNLRRDDIKDDHIEVTTVKTADSVSIELNSITRAILKKYKNVDFPNDKALPVIQNQPMNRHLKDLCKLAGINEKVRITTYKGSERKDEIKEKWELVGTHTGRKTFIVNCLSLGIAPNIVMKWTGHSDYKAMQPYIDIVDSVKASEMTKLNSLL